ncbi:MAG TPA: isocitrate/isopropylmalate dehydrogenase family protein [Vicinamibacterales bacterium]|nr:isocitrate/isopropylmalate dehydrogenase family protein [Vicinamibacterales bacterium]
MRIAVIPGDGIGVETTAEAVKVLRTVANVYGRTIDLEMLPWSAEHFLKTGVTIPANGYALLREFDAIFIGALGDPRVPDNRHARDILLGTRFELDLYVNYRPVKLLDPRLCPLKDRTTADVNFVVFRENTEGLYVSIGGRFKAGTEDEVAIQEELNTYKGVHRIIKHAFEFARASGRRRVCMADKSNAMTQGHALWQRVFRELAAQYRDVEPRHLYIDALVLLMVQNPAQFDIIVTNNLFGDIITDLGAALQGGLGLAASGNLHPGKTSMFEPVHGSAPPLAGKNIANPMGAILSAALMLDYLGWHQEAAAIEAAVHDAVVNGQGTTEIGGALGTGETGDYIASRITAPEPQRPEEPAGHEEPATHEELATPAVGSTPEEEPRVVPEPHQTSEDAIRTSDDLPASEGSSRREDNRPIEPPRAGEEHQG